MMGKANRPPSGEPWVWLTRELLESDAWRSLGINARRLIDFLLLEHMRHGGKQNGKLKAPKHQLEAFGIGSHYVTDAIHEVEQLGLVDCHRGGMRVATTYTLTWLTFHDGTPASDRWRNFRNPDLLPLPAPKSKNLGVKEHPGLGVKEHPDGQNLGANQHPDRSKNLGAKRHHPYRSSYQGGAARFGVDDGEARDR
jgi:hypothetical protein